MGKFILVIYRYRPIRKLDLSAVIGIGRYGKKLIDRTLPIRLRIRNRVMGVLMSLLVSGFEYFAVL